MQTSTNPYERDPLLHAVATGDIPAIETLLHQGYSVNPIFAFAAQANPLFVAIKHNQDQTAKFLVTQGADVNYSDIFDETPLSVAAAQENVAMLSFLLEAGANANRSSLVSACKTGNEAIVNLLLDHGAEVQTPSGLNNLTPLHGAVISGNTHLVGMLLEKGADVNALGGFFQKSAPLVYAAENGDVAMIEFLIEHGANLNTYIPNALANQVEEGNSTFLDLYCSSALFNAILNKQLPAMEVLFHAGVDQNLGLTPIHLAILKGDTAEISHFTTEEVNASDQIGFKPIHYAVLTDNADMIDALVHQGADIKAPVSILIESNSYSPLQLAAASDSVVSAEMLIKYGAPVNEVNLKGESALHLAAQTEASTEMFDILIKHGASINLQDNEGDTALHQAIKEQEMDAVKTLLAHQADPYIKNHQGESSFDLAKQYLSMDEQEINDLLHTQILPKGVDETLPMTDIILTSEQDIPGLAENTTVHTPEPLVQHDTIVNITLSVNNELASFNLTPQVVLEHPII